MKVLIEKKKLFALIALICFAVTLLTNLISELVSTINLFGYMFSGFGEFLIAVCSLCVSVLVLATALCYAGSAFFVWRKDNHMKLLALAGLCTIASLFLGFVNQIISFITYDYFQFTFLVSLFFGDIMPFLVAAFLIVFSVVKVKGPVVPIAGAVLIVLLCGSELLGSVRTLFQNISMLINYFDWDLVWNLITNLFANGINIVTCAGLLLLVPAALYIPREEADDSIEIAE